jgi:hypothetical protein
MSECGCLIMANLHFEEKAPHPACAVSRFEGRTMITLADIHSSISISRLNIGCWRTR